MNKTSDTPCFVFFCWDDNGKMLVSHYQLATGGVEKAYNSLIEVINGIAESEKMILPKLRKELGVYRQARESIEQLIVKNRFERDSVYGNWLLSTLSSIVAVFHI